MSDLKEIKMQDVVDAVMQAAYGTVKVMQSALEAAQLIAKITTDVIETLREAGIIIDRTPEPIPATNARSVSAESKIAHMACLLLMAEPPVEDKTEDLSTEGGQETEIEISNTGRVSHTVKRQPRNKANDDE